MDESVSLRIDALEQAGAMQDALAAGATGLREQASVVAALSDGQLRSVIWKAIRAEVDFDLFDWLAEGWISLGELRELKGTKGEAHCAFGKRPVRGELHPVVTVTVAGASCDLPFTLALIAEFDAVMLTVANGRITEFLAGACDLLLETSYRDKRLCEPTKIKSFATPFRHALKAPGLAIP
jgi:hypothetical protein